MPESRFKVTWNIVVTILLLYTALFVPYRTAFIDESTTFSLVFDTFIDTLFITDLFVNFFSAYEDKEVGVEVRHRKIILAYLKSWFLLDIVSCFPTQLLEVGNSSSEGEDGTTSNAAS